MARRKAAQEEKERQEREQQAAKLARLKADQQQVVNQAMSAWRGGAVVRATSPPAAVPHWSGRMDGSGVPGQDEWLTEGYAAAAGGYHLDGMGGMGSMDGLGDLGGDDPDLVSTPIPTGTAQLLYEHAPANEWDTMENMQQPSHGRYGGGYVSGMSGGVPSNSMHSPKSNGTGADESPKRRRRRVVRKKDPVWKRPAVPLDDMETYMKNAKR